MFSWKFQFLAASSKFWSLVTRHSSLVTGHSPLATRHWSLVLLLLCLPATARAHSVHAECRIRGDQVEVRVYFGNDVPAPHAQMTVLDESNNTIATGQTSADGRWAFPLPPPGKYALKADAGTGHRVTTRFTVLEVAAAEEGAALPVTDQGTLPDSLWLRAAIGLLIIGMLAGGLQWWLRKRRECPV